MRTLRRQFLCHFRVFSLGNFADADLPQILLNDTPGIGIAVDHKGFDVAVSGDDINATHAHTCTTIG